MKKLTTTSLVVALAGTASAGGLQRPSGISPRGTGMGGAFVAFADDPSAIYFNPAALDAMDPQIMVGGELVYGPRTYTPVAADGTRGPEQSTTIVAPVPSIGLVGRFGEGDRPSRITVGLGVFNTFGGDVSYDKTGLPALDKTRETGLVHFHSRSRGRLWMKGETSGHVLRVQELLVDCDQDALLVKALPEGPACHTGARSCFYRALEGDRLRRID